MVTANCESSHLVVSFCSKHGFLLAFGFIKYVTNYCRIIPTPKSDRYFNLSPNTLGLPSLELVQGILASTASADFASNASATYNAAHEWYEQKLLLAGGDTKASHLVCSEYASGQSALTSLTHHFSATAVHPVANSELQGSCFLVTVSAEQSVKDVLLEISDGFNLVSTCPLLPMLKIAPGILEHPSSSASPPPNTNTTTSNTPLKLRTRYGMGMQLENVRGLSVRLFPGVLPHRDSSAATFLKELQVELTSDTFSMHRDVFWSDPAAPRGANGEHVVSDSLEGAIRVHEWTRAADVVHGLAVKNWTTAGEVCGLGRARMSYVDSELFIIEGIKTCVDGFKAIVRSFPRLSRPFPVV